MGVFGLDFIWDTGDPEVLCGFLQDPQTKSGTESQLTFRNRASYI